MPIAATSVYPAEHWEEVKSILTKAIESISEFKFTVKMVSEADDVGIIQRRIVQNIYSSDIVVCDVSGKNANVMFELGMRLTFDKPTVIIKDDDSEYTFDTRMIEHLSYPRDLRYAKIISFAKNLKEKVLSTYKASRSDPNYSTFLKSFGDFRAPSLSHTSRISSEDVTAVAAVLVDQVQVLIRSLANTREEGMNSAVAERLRFENRALFDDRVAQQLRAASYEENTVALVLIDLERFRFINDTLGRHIADGLLKLVAERLQSIIFDRDNLVRIHADIFAALFPGIKDEADIARLVEEKIIGCLSRSFTIAEHELRISAKIGVALFPSDATEPDALFSCAEAALRQAKDSSERYLFYAPRMNARVAERLKLENKLQRALKQGEFVLFYLPKTDLSTGRITGLEALMRWNDPESGLVSPMLFIPVLEETGMIVEVGAWAMKQAVSQYAAWQAAGLPPLRIAVNVSPVQLKRKNFVTSVQQAIAIAGKPGHGLDLEITESMIMEDIEASIEKLKLIRDLGVEISIDDFGTGYSSLSYLTRLPLTALKIDRAFVQDMTTNSDNLAIVSTIITLAHTLNLKVIAEGVETEEQSKLLRLLKCDEMQGYLFSRPVPAERVLALVVYDQKMCAS